MLFLLSPAKTLDFESPLPPIAASEPRLLDQSGELITSLRRKSVRQIAQLMDLSDKLATLNHERYQAWTPAARGPASRPAILAFHGDVYEGLQAGTLTPEQLRWAQSHLRLLSGLYGVLRPLDGIQAHRLEMGTALRTRRAASLYAFWGDRIARTLNEDLAADPDPVVVNLASQEYFRSVARTVLQARVIECVFEDWKDDRYKVISFFAKRARGLMARHAIVKRVRQPAQLRSFTAEGYALAPEVSEPDRLVFRRRQPGMAEVAQDT